MLCIIVVPFIKHEYETKIVFKLNVVYSVKYYNNIKIKIIISLFESYFI